LARRYVTTAGSDLAAIWDSLPELTRRGIITQIRDGLHLARDGAGDGLTTPTHEPLGTADKPFTHRHSHHLSGDTLHFHTHSHSGDSRHIGHDHGGNEDVSPDARTRRFRIVNAAPRPDPWDQLALLGAKLERGQR
jgi:hypothetical protein